MALDEVVLENEFGRAVYSPLAGASLRSLRVNGRAGGIELLSGGDAAHDPRQLPSGTGSFVMAPWPNRIPEGKFDFGGREWTVALNSGKHAIHGTVRDRAFEVVEANEERARFATELGEGWPFGGSMAMDVSLDGASLVQTIEIRSGGEDFPAGFGWHPWFRRSLGSGDVSIRADADARWILDEEMTPSGEVVEPEGHFDLRGGVVPEIGRLDECYRMAASGGVALTWPEVELAIVSSEAVGHLQVYSPEASLCVEPQTCCVNAFGLAARGIEGTGTRVVTAGEPLRGWTRWSWGGE